MGRVRTTDRGVRKKYRWVGHQLLNEKSPVVEVVVHSEVARLIDVAQQPRLAAHVTHSVSLYKYSRKKRTWNKRLMTLLTVTVAQLTCI